MFVVSLVGFRPSARFDATPWTQARIEEAATATDTFAPLETVTLSPVDPDPEHPLTRDFTTGLATLASGWYRVVFIDASGHEETSGPVSATSATYYTDPDGVRSVLADSSDPGTAAALEDWQLYAAIQDAQAEVDARVPGAPPATVPPLLVNLTRDIAAYLATLTHRKGDPIASDDPVRLRYQRAQQILTDISAGRIELSGAPDSTADVAVVNPYEGALWDLRDLELGPAPAYRRWPLG